MSGQHNTGDWLTRGRAPEELNNDSHWRNGPPILYRPIEEWGLKFNPKKEPLPGETKVHVVAAASVEALLIDYERFSNINKAIWVVARLLNIAKKSFKGGRTLSISVKQLQEAENFIVKEVQKSFESELTKTDRKGRKGGRVACLNPVQDESGLWVVGQRLKNINPMTVDSSLQKLLPYRHHVTRFFMQRAHTSGHRGRDATLARFHQLYWVTQGSKLAQSIKSKCQICKLREAKFLEQQMGQLPEARLKPSPAFNHVMIDLFGPYSVREEVQKRTNGP
ncbi:Hypothetical predicted protein [Paramuricea clavata]|uniref:Uncharacterized protein n=1 Tax=Paramuricea clavata TaxID=317549 RepID=A0A7D9I4I2_PARCT|nr:Hypothetical predicted protein [Paramuricea clavata]